MPEKTRCSGLAQRLNLAHALPPGTWRSCKRSATFVSQLVNAFRRVLHFDLQHSDVAIVIRDFLIQLHEPGACLFGEHAVPFVETVDLAGKRAGKPSQPKHDHENRIEA